MTARRWAISRLLIARRSPAHEKNIPGLGVKHLVNIFEKGGLAAPVGADEAHKFPFLHVKVNAAQNFPAAHTVADLFCLDHAAPPIEIRSGAP